MGEGFINYWNFLSPHATIHKTTAVCAVEFFFGNTELSLELWTVIAGVSGLDDY